MTYDISYTHSVPISDDQASEIVVNVLLDYLDEKNFPETRTEEFKNACKEVLHYIMIPNEWEAEFNEDFVAFSEKTDDWWSHYCNKQDDVMSFEKGAECDWCGMREDVVKQNRKTIAKNKMYQGWKE